MIYQESLQDLFAAVQCPICQVSAGGDISFKLLPQRFAHESEYVEKCRALARKFTRSAGDPQYLAAADGIAALRLPDFSVVLIGPLPHKARSSKEYTRLQLHSVNLFLKMAARFISLEVKPSEGEEEVRERITRYVPKELQHLTDTIRLNAPHNQFRYEAAMIDAIKSGDLKQLERAFAMPLGGKIGILGPTRLRSLKNHAHICNILSSRAAIAEGIPSEDAFTLSDKFFNAVERLEDPDECWAVRTLIAQAFTLQIKDYKENLNSHEPPLVKKARLEITRRIFAKTTVQEIADAVGCSADYLGQIFKACHHRTLSEYLRHKRIETARELLSDSQASIEDIAQLLHFSSSAHFCRVFKEECGLTALQYRAQCRGQD